MGTGERLRRGIATTLVSVDERARCLIAVMALETDTPYAVNNIRCGTLRDVGG